MDTPFTRATAIAKIREHFSQPGAELGISYEHDDDGTCLYREDGDPASPVRCGIGVLIPNDLYSNYIEGASAGDLLHEKWALSSVFGADITPIFLDRVQEIHDKIAKEGGTASNFLAALDQAVNDGLLD